MVVFCFIDVSHVGVNMNSQKCQNSSIRDRQSDLLEVEFLKMLL